MTSDDFLPAATGVGTHLQSVAALLAARGHQVMVITTRRTGQPHMEDWNGVRVVRVATVRMFGFDQALAGPGKLSSLIAEFQPDLIHHHYLGVMLVMALAVAKRAHMPQIYTYHMTEDHLTQPWPMRPFKGLIRRGIGYCCKRVDHIISVSQKLAQQIVARNYGTPVSYISNPVNFSQDAAASDASTGSAFTVLFAGRLNPEKNIPLLLRGFALVLAQRPDARLLIAGEGSQRGPLLRMAAELNIEASTSFLGFLPASELAVRYRSCDVFVLPSWVETQGLVAMEAMHFGKPILVARSVVSAEELVDEGVNGYLVDPRAEADLARRLLALADDPALRKRMGQAGRCKAERYRPELVAEQLETLYRATLIGAGQRADVAGR